MDVYIIEQTIEGDSPDEDSEFIFNPAVLIPLKRVTFSSESKTLIPRDDAEEQIDSCGMV